MLLTFGASQGTEWKFIPADMAWQNAITESHVTTVKIEICGVVRSHPATSLSCLFISKKILGGHYCHYFSCVQVPQSFRKVLVWVPEVVGTGVDNDVFEI